MNDNNDPLKSLSVTRRNLGKNADKLDADTREKLMQIRHRAMESSLEGESNFPEWATLPIIAFVTAVIFVLLIYVKPGSALKLTMLLMIWNSCYPIIRLSFTRTWSFFKNGRKIVVQVKKKLINTVFCMTLLTSSATPCMSQEDPIKWNALNSDQKQILAPLQDKWGKLSPAKQKRLNEGAKTWNELSLEQKKISNKNFKLGSKKPLTKKN